LVLSVGDGGFAHRLLEICVQLHTALRATARVVRWVYEFAYLLRHAETNAALAPPPLHNQSTASRQQQPPRFQYTRPLYQFLEVALVRSSALTAPARTASATAVTATAVPSSVPPGTSLAAIVAVALFGAKLLHWGYQYTALRPGAPRRTATATQHAEAVIPAPSVPASAVAVATGEAGECPLCRCPRRHPATTTGGYVFCHPCVLAHIQREGPSCPISGVYCGEADLIKLYSTA